MAKFPDPIHLPDKVYLSRHERNVQVLKAAKKGIVIRCLVILFELCGVYFFKSSALFMDALASSFDVISSVLLVICIKLAARPPDREHPFGHGRYEPLAGFQMGILLIVMGVGLAIQQALQLNLSGEGKVMDPRAWMVPFTATILLEICYQVMIRAAKKEHSPALAADAMHYRLDAFTSLLATIALIGAVFAPHWSVFMDHIGAILIAVLMVGIGIQAFRANLNQIMDRVPDSDWFERVRSAALGVPGVRDTEKIRIQLCGPDAHVDIDIEVDPLLPVEQAHKISQKVRVEIQKTWPAVQDVTVHIEPFYPGDH